jgi:transposase-like protein
MGGKNRSFTAEYRVGVAKRILEGESVSALSRETEVKRSILYRWREAYRRDGEKGLSRPTGRPPGTSSSAKPPGDPQEALQRRIAELERKVGQQQLENDFLRRAFKRVEELRQSRRETGATASTPKSGA